MNEKIFVTGATGNAGSQVVKHLREADVDLVASKLPHEETEDEPGLKYRLFDFTDRSTWNSCLEGVTRVFLMRPPHISRIRRDMLPFMKYLKDRNIQQVVFLSVQGVEGNKMIPHYKVEKYCRDLGLPYTFIRPSFFMQNLTTTHLSEIRDDHMVFVPAGKGKINFIDVRDIGEVAAELFLDEKHIRRAYTITGEKSYACDEIAAHLSRGFDEHISYENPNPIRFLFYHIRRKRKLAMTLVMLALYTVVRFGKADITTDDTEILLGRKPRSLEDFILSHRDILKGESIDEA